MARHSREWIRFNESARAKGNRERHVAKNGGTFVKTNSGWEWVQLKLKEVKVKAPAPAIAPVSRRRRKTTGTTSGTEGE